MTSRSTTLAPDGQWMAVTYGGTADRGKRDNMAVWVTESSYVEPRTIRGLVGTSTPATIEMALLDLENHALMEVDLKSLPGITDQPLDAIRAHRKTKNQTEAAAQSGGEEDEESKAPPRPVRVSGMVWNEDGSRLAFQAYSTDNKDRWIATVDVAEAGEPGENDADRALQPTVVERRTDEAWIGRISSGMGWLDQDRLWFQSEATGYSHLYLHDAAVNITEQLTSGDFEVTSVAESPDGQYLYFRANMEHPGVTETHRVDVSTRKIEQITNLGGMNSSILSPDGEQLLITHSEMMRPAELYVQAAVPGARATRVTETVTEEFESMPWVQPTVVEIPNENGRPIYSRLYLPPDAGGEKRPVVMFIHGAGYLQNAHQGWSNYSREFMFHSLLARRGYVVLDMDYRASAGYGRDWRTAIYRQMGTPELADLVSGVEWLVANHDVDPARVGCYGGSYGGFMTLMALFNAPEVFKSGAALRPVTDWAHYNHGYTSNILNTPEDDPEAYEVSSPIEFAEGLEGHLLICHGMLDSNVFFQDTVRLVQRLIELEKENWETAIFPVEAHGFRQPSSWLDEYRRILKLFESTLR
jgi:dipeptidyl aminopeptidase/acylaminoacyl peptidase